MVGGVDNEVYNETFQSQTSGGDYDQFMSTYEFNEMQTQDQYKKARSKNFSPEEDLLLVSTWLNTSIDPIHGTDQTNSQYWSKMEPIQQAVNKFCGYYTQREGRLRKFGDTGIDVLEVAKKIYHEIQKTQFRLENCWNKLRFNAKWIEYMCQGPTKRKTFSSDTTNLNDEKNTSADFIDLERPIGQKKTKKEAKRGKDKSSNISEFDAAIIKWTKEK
ncbi:glutathione S-transferase T2-like [Impatiens glandulifera]|uniref:glutathione S-transferase T2-like n=1 Tax=Impatiens glandulifera TaxID=253017 RepID=UPI001FB17AAF|nr:glutathione S-transferase T2-like [Impatiens glandulifera]